MIVYGGEKCRSVAAVQNGHRLGLWWDEGDRGTRKRRTPISQIVLHHQGGEGGAQQLYRVLDGGRVSRRSGKPIFLSVHFSIDRDGQITQHADLETCCFHAGGWNNDRSVGIEIANRGLAPAAARVPRVAYKDTLHGRELEFLRFTPEQVGAVHDLLIDLVGLLHVPYEFPTKQGALVTREMSQGAIKDFRGILGHWHLTRKKIDPSPHLIRDLMASASIVREPEAPNLSATKTRKR